MADDELAWLPATTIAQRVRAGDLRVADIAEECLERVARLNPTLNALVHHDPAQVRSGAARLDAAIARGEDPGPLAGVPYSLKESTAAAGLPHTGGMKAAEGHVAAADAVVTRRLAAAGGLFLGKTNLPENGYKGVTDNHLYGATRNPWNPDWSPGGSTGGGAAGVAAGLTALADGSDGAGSIRIPAAMSGVVGFKPSTGRIPQELLPTGFATFLSHGVLARSVADAALMASVESGPDAVDPLSLPAGDVDWLAAVDLGDGAPDLTGWRIAWSPDLGFPHRTDPEVLALCEDAVRRFADLGATVVDATPAWSGVEEAMWSAVWLPAYAGDADYYDWDALEGQVDPELKEIAFAGARQTGAAIAAGEIGRTAVYRAFRSFMEDYDVLVSPTVRVAGIPVGMYGPPHLDGLPLRQRMLGWLNTYPFNMTDTPAASIPVGLTAAGLPVGIQIAGGHLADARVLRAAAALERALPWTARPPVS
ncbi:amidase family protein [Cnuibacter physcomitrellae]|uniref:Amidase n=1 Tax=Cnuibacter physcomitrellae TaxID=1619308 RepID=A0A1X9LG26_9MICO|nr:amidase [Cnuibacter physcomitrellae]ARJ04166.1 amidase [Cnuibacter physcomitrellae]GGI40412.1 amidase family protein [Cnuibacter physcomitrellae]